MATCTSRDQVICNAVQHNECVIRGDSHPGFTVRLLSNSQPIDLTNVSAVQMQIRQNSPTGTILTDLTLGSGISIPTPADGKIVIEAFSTASWPDASSGAIHFYDVQVTDSSLSWEPWTPVTGQFEVLQDVTQ